jgi:hypothetical protein
MTQINRQFKGRIYLSPLTRSSHVWSFEATRRHRTKHLYITNYIMIECMEIWPCNPMLLGLVSSAFQSREDEREETTLGLWRVDMEVVAEKNLARNKPWSSSLYKITLLSDLPELVPHNHLQGLNLMTPSDPRVSWTGPSIFSMLGPHSSSFWVGMKQLARNSVNWLSLRCVYGNFVDIHRFLA